MRKKRPRKLLRTPNLKNNKLKKLMKMEMVQSLPPRSQRAKKAVTTKRAKRETIKTYNQREAAKRERVRGELELECQLQKLSNQRRQKSQT